MNTILHYFVEGTRGYDGEDWQGTSPLKEFRLECSLALPSLPVIKERDQSITEKRELIYVYKHINFERINHVSIDKFYTRP